MWYECPSCGYVLPEYEELLGGPQHSGLFPRIEPLPKIAPCVAPLPRIDVYEVPLSKVEFLPRYEPVYENRDRFLPAGPATGASGRAHLIS